MVIVYVCCSIRFYHILVLASPTLSCSNSVASAVFIVYHTVTAFEGGGGGS